MRSAFALLFLLAIMAMLATFVASDYVETPKTKEDVKSGAHKMEDVVIGIDLGTTYSCVGVVNEQGQVVIIENELGSRITPSCVSWTDAGERLIGDAAKNNAASNPKSTLYDVKRLIGRRYREVLKKDAKLLSYDLVDKDGRVYIKVPAVGDNKPQQLSPEEVSAMVLTKMKQIAEKYLGKTVKHAVITVPAYFNDQQRQATADAGKIAGLEVMRIFNEPTAAAMAYGLYKEKEHNILVFDLGGGTFDVSLLTIDNGVFEVIATSGDTHLGGEDFDLRVVEYLAKLVKDKYGKDVSTNMRSFQMLKREAEKAKRTLSSETETLIEIESLIEGIDFSEKLTRAQFEKLNVDLFQKTLAPVKQVLKDSGLSKSDVDEIVLVGGSTRIPKVKDLLSDFFEGKKLNQEVNPDEAVAYGAAVQAGILSGHIQSNLILIDVTPLSLGIETEGGIMATLIPRNTPIPAEKSDTFTTTHDYQERLLIPVYEGERKQTKFNRLLGELELVDLPPAPRGVPQIKVTFQLTQDGILKVIAEDTATKNKKELTIRKGTLSSDEIKRMQDDADKHAEEDQKVVELAEARNKLMRFVESIRSQLHNKNVQDKLKSSTGVDALKAELKKVEKWLGSPRSGSAGKEQFDAQFKAVKKAAASVFAQLYGEAAADRMLDGEEGSDEDDSGIDTDEALKIDDDDQSITVSDDDKPIGKDEL